MIQTSIGIMLNIYTFTVKMHFVHSRQKICVSTASFVMCLRMFSDAMGIHYKYVRKFKCSYSYLDNVGVKVRLLTFGIVLEM